MNAIERMRAAQAAIKSADPIDAEVVEEIKKPNVHRLAQLQKDRAIASADSEMNRILEMPIDQGIDAETLQSVNEYFVHPEEMDKKDGFRMFPTQAEAVVSYAKYGGGFMPITVGGGKTLTSILIANEAFRNGKNRIMLVIPPSLVDQLRDVDFPFYRSKCLINVPVHFIPGLSATKRMSKAKSGCRGLYIFTFSLLSSPQGAEILDAISPETVIIDEAHNLSGARSSARSKRFNDFLDDKRPEVVALSGTMTRSSPMEYHSLARHSLKEYNFMPNIKTMAQMWADAIGSGASSGIDDNDKTIGVMTKPLFPIIQWARNNFPEETFDVSLAGFRKAFRNRLVSGPGVTSSGEDHLDVELHIINDTHPAPHTEPGWDLMQELIQQVNDEWVTPSGEELEHAMHIWKWLYEIEGAGFYNELYWPSMEWIEKYRSIKGNAAEELLERSQKYHEAHQDFSRQLRDFLGNNSEKGLDTPMLVGHNMSVHGPKIVGDLLYETWMYMKECDFEGRLERLKKAVRVCPFKINQAVKFAKTLPEGEGCIFWYYSAEVGRWLTEALREAGLPVVYCPAGKVYNAEAIKLDHKDKMMVASISAHGTGKNLQHFRHERYVQWPRDAKLAEQSLGRIHRNGQKADKVYVRTDFAGDFDRGIFSATLNDAAYIHQTLGNKQRLIYAKYDPMPEVVPIEVLKEWGAISSGSHTDKESQALLKDTFGGKK